MLTREDYEDFKGHPVWLEIAEQLKANIEVLKYRLRNDPLEDVPEIRRELKYAEALLDAPTVILGVIEEEENAGS